MKTFIAVILAGAAALAQADNKPPPSIYGLVRLDASTYAEMIYESRAACQDHLATLEALGGHTMGCHDRGQMSRMPGCINTELPTMLSKDPFIIIASYECIYQ